MRKNTRKQGSTKIIGLSHFGTPLTLEPEPRGEFPTGMDDFLEVPITDHIHLGLRYGYGTGKPL